MKRATDMVTQDGRPAHARVSPLASGSGPVWDERMRAGISREEMAERLHCSVSTIRRAEKNGTGIAGQAVSANLKMAPSKYNYRPSTIYTTAVAMLRDLLEIENSDMVRRACAEVTAEANKRDFARINGLTEARYPSLDRMKRKGTHILVEESLFVDHPSLWLKDGKPAVFLSEVYELSEDVIESLSSFCKAHDLKWFVRSLPSSHFPGAIMTIIIHKKGLSLRLVG